MVINIKLPDGKILIPCYHPSPRNVNTKVINSKNDDKFIYKGKANILNFNAITKKRFKIFE